MVRVMVGAQAIVPAFERGRGMLAHPGLPPGPHDVFTAWSFDPTVLAGLLIGAWIYRRGVQALWRRAGVGRGIARWRPAAFAGGILTLGIALISPVDALGSVLFSAHMVQHMLLILLAAPLLVIGQPERALIWALRPDARRAVGGCWRRRGAIRTAWFFMTAPASAWVLHAATVWLWHLPGPYQAALAHEGIHVLEHVSFLGTALLLWWMLPGTGPHARLDPAVAVLYLFTYTMQGGVLGAMMTFARVPRYSAYVDTTAAWGLTPL